MTFYPLATEPFVRSIGPPVLPSAFIDLVNEAQSLAQFLVEIKAYKGGEARSGGLSTVSEIPVASHPLDAGVDIGQVNLSYADKHWTGSPTDADKPNEFYEGRVNVPLALERFMPLLPEESRRVQRQFGDIQIANGDGSLDPIVQAYAVDGRQVRVLLGPTGGAYAEFGVVADVVATGWFGDSLSVRIGLRDRTFTLDKPFQTTIYGGTGGADGTAEIEGKPKPLVFGRVRNIAPLLVDPSNLIFQVHDGVVSDIDAVWDQGAAITDSATDVSGYAALVAESVSSGFYATANDVGLFKLGALPNGLVTCDVLGDATPTYTDTLDGITIRILRDRHGLEQKFINIGTFIGAASLAGAMGIYIGWFEQPTTSQVLSNLLGSVAGWWGAARDGRIRAGRLVDPARRSVGHFLTEFDIISLVPEIAPIPRWRARVSYQRNWTPQRGEDLAASVTAARRQFLTQSSLSVATTDATIQARHLNATDPPPLQSFFDTSTPAQALSDYIGGLHSPDRQVFTIVVSRVGFLMDFGTILNVKWPRYGLTSGKNFSIIGLREEPDQVTLRIWG